MKQAVFTVEGDEYRWEDVVLAAARGGDWLRLETAVHEGVACLQWQQRSGEPFDDALVEQAAAAFRYSRGLERAEDAHAWLARWGVSADDWLEYLRRSALRRHWAPRLTDIVARHPVGAREIDTRLGCEAVCSGELARLAQRLAAHAAAAAELGEPGDGGAPGADGVAPASLDRLGALLGLSPTACRDRLARFTRLACAFETFSSRVVTEAAIQAQIQAYHLDWLRIRGQRVSLPDEQMAREAALCVREDGRTLAEVAAESGTSASEVSLYLDALEPSLRPPLVGAAPGELLGPLAWDGGFSLFLVVDKTAPSADDAAIRARAVRNVVERASEHAVRERVRWHVEL